MPIRTREAIAADILQTALEATRTSKILRNANLNYDQFKNYMPILAERGLVQKSNETVWITTPKGREYLAAYSSLCAIDQLSILQ